MLSGGAVQVVTSAVTQSTRLAPGLHRTATQPDSGEVDCGDPPAEPRQPERVPPLPRREVDGVARAQVAQELRHQRIRFRRPLLPVGVPLVPVVGPHAEQCVSAGACRRRR